MADDTDFEAPSPSSEQHALVQRLMLLDALALRLEGEAVRMIGLKQPIEERWLEDLLQYNGTYDATTLARIKQNEGSEVFVNITRSKTRTVESKLSDMLFPTDDSNWGLTPTPVPELMYDLQDQKTPALDPETQQPMQNADGSPMSVARAAKMEIEEAKKRAEAMKQEIEDQLTEARYPTKCRGVIHNGCLLGTGVLKGPVVAGRTRRAWTQISDANGSAYVLKTVTDPRPGVEDVDPWNYFPDLSVANVEHCSFHFERSYKRKSDVKRLLQDPYYLRSQVLRLLKVEPRTTKLSRNPTAEKRESGSTEQYISTENDQYEFWEYHGPITRAELRACGVDISTLVEDADLPADDNDEMQGCVVFCGRIVVKAYLNPLETEEQVYSVFNYEKDEASIFGYGVPYRLRNAQKVLNAAWRALMDNAGLSLGPQIVINKGVIQPADGDWRLKGRKVWEITDRTRDVRTAMATFNIDSHQVELTAIIQMSEQFADKETGTPLIMQGEQGPGVTKTVQGMSLLMNNANVVQRGTVKNYDDGITLPMIRRFYDWNMQNSPREEIKGDFEVDARGSSVLLTKELQAQNLMQLSVNFAGHPIFGPMTKHASLYRKTVQAMHISSDDIVLSDEDIKANQQNTPADPTVLAEQAKQAGQQQLLQMKMQSEEKIEQIRAQARLEELQLEREIALAKLTLDERKHVINAAASERARADDLKGQIVLNQQKLHGDRQLIADESKVKKEFGSGI